MGEKCSFYSLYFLFLFSELYLLMVYRKQAIFYIGLPGHEAVCEIMEWFYQ